MTPPYPEYSPEQFAADEAFRRWVLQPTPQQEAAWARFLEEYPRQRAAVEEARRLVAHLVLLRQERPGYVADEVARSWQVIAARTAPPAPRRYGLTGWRWPVAAAAVLALGILGYFAWTSRTVGFQTPYGQIRTIRLPDGSTVVLNANSALSYRARDPRTVTMTGEAYFSVVRTADARPFVVRVPNRLRVDVLGTAFNVSDRGRQTRVVLETGRVRLQAARDTITLRPGQMMEWAGTRQRPVVREVRPALYASWRQNRLLLDNTALAELVEVLRSTYGLSVQVQDPALLSERVSGTMALGDPDRLLRLIAETYEVEVSRRGNQVRISR